MVSVLSFERMQIVRKMVLEKLAGVLSFIIMPIVGEMYRERSASVLSFQKLQVSRKMFRKMVLLNIGERFVLLKTANCW